MSIIRNQIKEAFDVHKKDGNLLKLVREIAHTADYSVHCQGHAGIMYEAIKQYCPPQVFECLYYDGENGEYHLFDFDPNILNKESLLIEIRSKLESDLCIEPDYISKAMESVYLLNTNTLIKVKSLGEWNG